MDRAAAAGGFGRVFEQARHEHIGCAPGATSAAAAPSIFPARALRGPVVAPARRAHPRLGQIVAEQPNMVARRLNSPHTHMDFSTWLTFFALPGHQHLAGRGRGGAMSAGLTPASAAVLMTWPRAASERRSWWWPRARRAHRHLQPRFAIVKWLGVAYSCGWQSAVGAPRAMVAEVDGGAHQMRGAPSAARLDGQRVNPRERSFCWQWCRSSWTWRSRWPPVRRDRRHPGFTDLVVMVRTRSSRRACCGCSVAAADPPHEQDLRRTFRCGGGLLAFFKRG